MIVTNTITVMSKNLSLFHNILFECITISYRRHLFIQITDVLSRPPFFIF